MLVFTGKNGTFTQPLDSLTHCSSLALTHSRTQELTNALKNSRTHDSRTHSRTRELTNSRTQSSTPSLTHRTHELAHVLHFSALLSTLDSRWVEPKSGTYQAGRRTRIECTKTACTKEAHDAQIQKVQAHTDCVLLVFGYREDGNLASVHDRFFSGARSCPVNVA